MVEQQVVVLEVVSSSLTIYPYMWQIEKLPNYNLTTLHQIYIYYTFFTRFWSKHVYRDTWSLQFSQLLSQIFLKIPNITADYKTLYKYNTFKQPVYIKPITLKLTYTHQLFNMYTTLLTQTTVITSQTHPSHRFNFIFSNKLNAGTFNLTKLRQKWVDMYHLFYNLFFYKLPILSFSTPTFRNELLSFNWSLNLKLRTYWKYVSPSFYLARNKVMNIEFLLFNYLSKQGFHMALIFDVLYHKNTIFLLHRNNFYTLGLVPLHTSLYTVNFALPISNESVFLHLFFIRVVIHIRKQAQASYFKQISNTWLQSPFL